MPRRGTCIFFDARNGSEASGSVVLIEDKGLKIKFHALCKRAGPVFRERLDGQASSLLVVSTCAASYARMIDMNTVTVSPKFQVVIPLEVRRRMKLEPGAKLMVVEFNGGLRLLPLKAPSALRGIARGIGTAIERDPDRTL